MASAALPTLTKVFQLQRDRIKQHLTHRHRVVRANLNDPIVLQVRSASGTKEYADVVLARTESHSTTL